MQLQVNGNYKLFRLSKPLPSWEREELFTVNVEYKATFKHSRGKIFWNLWYFMYLHIYNVIYISNSALSTCICHFILSCTSRFIFLIHSFIHPTKKQPLSNTDSLLNVCDTQKQHKHHFLSFFMLLCIIIMAIYVAMRPFISSSCILLWRGIRRMSKEVGW